MLIRPANHFRAWLKPVPGVRFALAWHVVGGLLGIAISTVIMLLDPFDMDRGVGERGRDAFYEIAAYAYPEANSPKTLVVLLDDAFLQSNQRTWPVSAATHAATSFARQDRENVPPIGAAPLVGQLSRVATYALAPFQVSERK